MTRWVQLARAKPVQKGEIFDLQAAAAMLSHGVKTVYTYNTADLQGIPGITALEPPAVAGP